MASFCQSYCFFELYRNFDIAGKKNGENQKVSAIFAATVDGLSVLLPSEIMCTNPPFSGFHLQSLDLRGS